MKKPENSNTNSNDYAVIDSMGVINCRMFNNGDVTADIVVNGVTIYGCRVVEGKNGDFLSFPARKGNDGKYYSHAFVKLSPDDQAKLIKAIETKLNSK